MDKFINNRWVMKIIALLLAFMLYMSVSIENSVTQQTESKPSPFSGSTDVQTVTDVPVESLYDRENLVVSGVPQSVTVTLEGPTASVKPTALQKDFEIIADLSNLGIGTHQVTLESRNLSERLSVAIEPSVASVTIHERISEDFPVDVDFINRGQMEEGYQAEQPIVKPNIVKVTGSRELIESIALVKARVDLKGVNESIEQQSRVTVYDREGNTLNVEIDPPVVDVNVPITSPFKSVPLKINRKGSLKEDLSITKIEAEPNEVTVYGPKSAIDKLEFIDNIELDLTEITESTTIEVDVPVPDGVKRVVPEKVKINVEVEKEEQKTFTNVPIQQIGLSEGLELEFIDPENGLMDLTVLGAPSTLEGVNSSDMEMYINVTDLNAGEHEAPLEINGPQNVSWDLPKRNVKFRLIEETNE
ncbi:CdaR family protein [Sutcliffiella horikoshii]|uniref:YbbR-like domain-containing protein n=1 Tax=Sutcliffiella horikoshii TaxID=79883 RepID=A0A1Y0CHD9_9BACI|nr:YbbR-like domain-containing protein [Sutcliffiella horikoshii]ART74718.1 YbbR-like domain-containing protein YbbR [Sutcliffiella horikoshii]TYS57314.1 YbbR-like domain-containing protein [Sutcliffiella horikoshii]